MILPLNFSPIPFQKIKKNVFIILIYFKISAVNLHHVDTSMNSTIALREKKQDFTSIDTTALNKHAFPKEHKHN